MGGFDTHPHMRGDIRLRVPDTDGKDGSLNEIGSRVEQRRLQLRLRMEKLCSRVEDITGGRWRPTRQDVYRIMRGTRSISTHELAALSLAIETDPVWLLIGDVSPEVWANELMNRWQAHPIESAVEDQSDPDI